MDLSEVDGFYGDASDAELEAFETALDRDDVGKAKEVLNSHQHRTAKEVGYLDEPPGEGDLVYVDTTNRYARLIAISDDREHAAVSSQNGPVIIPYTNCHRIR